MRSVKSPAAFGSRLLCSTLGSILRYSPGIRDRRGRGRRLATPSLGLERLEPRQLLSANPIITEIMADNDDNVGLGDVENRVFNKPDPFGDGSTPDWIELFNAGDEALDLAGYHLTDDSDNLTQWTFPSTVLEPGQYLLVYASGATSTETGGGFVDAQGNLHTNFGLSAGGDYVALVAPDGTTVLSELGKGGRDFPDQVSDVSYGFVQTAQLLHPGSDVQYWVPIGGDLGTDWTAVDFNPADNGFTAGTASLGYESRPTDRTNFTDQIETEIPAGVHAVYVRAEFDVSNAAGISDLLLRMKYDNGFIAYLNGIEVLRDNAPANTGWFSTAPSGSRRDSLAKEFADFDLAEHSGLLQDGKNVLAIHLLNNLSDNSDMLLSLELFADKPVTEASTGYLLTPTPGASNIVFDALTGPLISNVTENPGELADDQDLVVTAIVRQHNAPIDSVSMNYRTNFEDEVAVAMVDDGSGADKAAGDGIYSAVIPASASQPGDMVRWRVTASDASGGTMRWPMFADPIDSDQYFGTIVTDPSVSSSKLPILYWFVENPRGAESARGARGSYFFLGEFYDNVDANIHGQSSSGFPKKSYDIDFNAGNRFKWQDGEARVRDINLLTNWADKGKFRNTLGYEVPRLAGDPAMFAFPVRVQQNGEFFSTADMVEDADDRTLERWGLNPDGALYKMYNTFDQANAVGEKKTRKWEDQSDLQALRDATNLRGDEWLNYAMDNVDIPAFVNFQVVQDVTSNHDCCHKNYYYYRDTGQTDEWRPIIWDVDLTFGHHWRSSVNYFEDRMSWDNGLEQGSNNKLISKIWSGVPGFKDMYFRRLRTLMDQFVQPVDTPYEDRYLETRLDEFVELIDPHDDPFDPTPNPPEFPRARFGTVQGTDDADLDYNHWGSWENGNGSRAYAARGETMREHIQRVKDEFADQRREYLYDRVNVDAQVGNPPIGFGVIEVEPTSGNPAEQYLQLINNNDVAVDISGWKLTEGVDFTFPGGTVIPAGFTLYVVADKVAFRARAEGPSGGQGLFMVGGWDGQLSPDGESLTLMAADGTAVKRVFVGELGDPTPVQQFLRVTEVNYAPLPPNTDLGELDDGTPNAADNFEFIELTNTGNQTLDLAGVTLSAGIQFTFPDGSTLGPGQQVLVVKNQAAFESRYGTGLKIAGEYSGDLADGGDSVFLDAAGKLPIPGQAFSYRPDGNWPDRAAGKGSSLQPIDTGGDYDVPSNWRASVEYGGSPGAAGPVAPPAVVISEVMPDGPQPAGDRVELHNTSSQAIDISGWYLSNSSDNYGQFVVPAGTTIAAGGYQVFDQNQLGFQLDQAHGDKLWLIQTDAGGQPVKFVDFVSFGTTGSGIPLGPWPDADSPLRPLDQPTFGGPNTGYGAGDVVISEVYYNPLDPDGAGQTKAQDFEFVELYNRTDSPIDIGGWKITGPEEIVGSPDYTFPAATVINPQQTVVVVGFDPTVASKANVFKFTFGIPLGETLFGKLSTVRRYKGLNDERGVIQLVREGTPPADDPGFTPQIVVDEVAYGSTAPWPTGPAAGLGDSLARTQATAFANFPTSWTGRPAAPGTVEFFERLAGDANDDGQFDQLDITQVLQAAKYLSDEPAGWSEGDWTGDGRFDQQDIVAAMQAGAYLQGPQASLTADLADQIFGQVGG